MFQLFYTGTNQYEGVHTFPHIHKTFSAQTQRIYTAELGGMNHVVGIGQELD